MTELSKLIKGVDKDAGMWMCVKGSGRFPSTYVLIANGSLYTVPITVDCYKRGKIKNAVTCLVLGLSHKKLTSICV